MGRTLLRDSAAVQSSDLSVRQKNQHCVLEFLKVLSFRVLHSSSIFIEDLFRVAVQQRRVGAIYLEHFELTFTHKKNHKETHSQPFLLLFLRSVFCRKAKDGPCSSSWHLQLQSRYLLPLRPGFRHLHAFSPASE